MKILSLVVLAAAVLATASAAQAQSQRVWRCGNEYTNNPPSAQQRDCKVVEGGNVTVVQGTRPAAAAAAAPAGNSASSANNAVRAPAGSPRVEGVDQRARDGEVRSVLESELRKAEARQTELQKNFNNGEPEKQGNEARNYQKYVDRVGEMKAEMARNDSDIAGLRREIGRLPGLR